MNKFVENAKVVGSRKFTENGGDAFSSTNGGALLDLFGVVGALRTRADFEIESKFAAACKENLELATRLMFYARNVRGGLGERHTFRIMLKWFCRNYTDLAIANIPNVAEFGRFDDLYEYLDTPAEKAMWDWVFHRLNDDYEKMLANKPISLLAKWLKSINTSSEESRKLARRTMTALGFKTEKQYRKVLARMRDYLSVTEHQMSAQEWAEINYSQVPAYAIKNYGSAFAKHDYERWNAYLNALKNHTKGVKVNASTLYPYDLVRKIRHGWESYIYDELTEQQWKALPNYVGDGANVLVMADVSGSMFGYGREAAPIDSSIGLAIYFAQRNHGTFANLYMTFSRTPEFKTVRATDSLAQAAKDAFRDGGYNTDLDAAFRLVYNTAVRNNVPAEDMPRALVVISDMEIDQYMRRNSSLSFVDEWKRRFNTAGYTMPQLVLWNVKARQDTYLGLARENVKYLSGNSASTFRDLIDTLNCRSAYDAMVKILMNPMYDKVITKVGK